MINYLVGEEVRRVPGWAQGISDITHREPHLLPQSVQALQEAADDQRIILAIHQPSGLIVGCVALWFLCEVGRKRYLELGTVWAHPDFRSKSDFKVTQGLYQKALATSSEDLVLATTTNPAALKAGKHAGLVNIGFHRLPEEVRRATCVCPSSKTRVHDNKWCALRLHGSCFVRVSQATWMHLGKPEVSPLPFEIPLDTLRQHLPIIR